MNNLEILKDNIAELEARNKCLLGIIDDKEEQITTLEQRYDGLKIGYNELNEYSDKIKQQLDNQKYLDRDEILIELSALKIALQVADIKDWDICFNTTLNAICNLAIPENKPIVAMKDIIKSLEHDVKFWKDKSRGIVIKPITRDRIIEVLQGNLNISGLRIQEIANEILNNRPVNKEEECLQSE